MADEFEVKKLTNGHHVTASELTQSVKKREIPTATLKEVKVTDYMRECLDKVAAAEGFVDYEINVIHGSAIGDGFIGLIFKANIEEKESNKKLSVVLKSPPEGARRTDFKAMSLFEREVFLYSEVLPQFVKLQEERKIKKSEGFFNFPKCYFAEFDEKKDESVIIMEDLRDNGFKLYDKFTPTDFEHSKFVVEALAKLHAISFAMKIQKPEIFNKFKNLNDLMSENFFDKNFEPTFKGNIDRAAGTLPENDLENREKVLVMKENVCELIKDLVNPKNTEPFNVVGHGDCWSNNFMYHYKDESKLADEIVLLDWQISRYCSPAIDLVYFIFICTSGSMRANHYDELIEIYYESFKTFLNLLGGDAETQFPFPVLKDHLTKLGKFGIIMAALAIPMLTTKNEELPDMDYMAENMGKDPEAINEMMAQLAASNKQYKERMSASVLDAISYGYL